MPRYVISPAAERDMQSILAWSEDHFGVEGRWRYEALLVQGILDVAEDPERAGSQTRAEIAATARTYHLTHSRLRVTADVGQVRRARHFLLYPTRSAAVSVALLGVECANHRSWAYHNAKQCSLAD